MEVIGACGGLTATPDALIKFVSGIDYYPNVHDFLKKETLDLMYTPSKCYNNYGLGWRLNHSTLSNWGSYHGGNINGTATILVRGKNGVTCAVLCNSRSYTSGFDTALYLLADDIITITGTIGNTLILARKCDV